MIVAVVHLSHLGQDKSAMFEFELNIAVNTLTRKAERGRRKLVLGLCP